MTEAEIAFRPKLQFLSEDDKKKIHQAALTVLSDIGNRVMHDGALELLKNAGCEVEDGNNVKIKPELVEKALETAPSHVKIYNRLGEVAMDLGGWNTYFGTGSDVVYTLDPGETVHRHSELEDVRRGARVADAMANLDFIMSFGHAKDIEPSKSYLEAFRAMVENSIKPTVNTAENATDLAAMWEICAIVMGGMDEARAKPYTIQYSEPTSPLKHPVDSVDKLMYCARVGMPVIYSPAPIAGSTAPMTIAGHVAQGVAECFCGLVIHQLVSPGAPFIMGMGPAVLDMASGQCSYNAPEYYMSYLALIEMHHYFNLPNWGYAGTTDGQIADGQAAMEGTMSCFLAAMAGSNLNHDVGYTNFGLTGNLIQVVIMNEVLDQLRRMQRGAPVNDDHLAVDVIREAGTDGQFLMHPHTHKHHRNVQWRPDLIYRKGHKQWLADGQTTLYDRAKARVEKILENHQPVPLTEDQAKAIAKCVAGFKPASK